ncbi:MAG: glycosyltransferase [Bacteroidota bacterium]
MSAKKTILILCDWFLPGYLAGGPVQSIATLTQHLGSDIDFKIITTDRDFKATTAYNNVKVNEWTTFSDRQVFYVSPENMNADFILKLIQNTRHDTIYLNSLFSKFFTVYPLKWRQQGKIKSNIVLAPRGMLGEGALAIKFFKKKLFLTYARTIDLFENVYWQSTSAQETAEIKQRIGSNVRIAEVSNLPNIPNGITSIIKQKGELKLCFISRISEKKNLNFAIDILKEIKDFKIVFDVFGPVEDENYWNICKKNAASLPTNINFNYKGYLMPEEISETLSLYHSLFLPTKNENYGHIIVETLQHGRSVILSDQTPWRNLQKYNIGFDIDLKNINDFLVSIRKLGIMNQLDFDTMSFNCISYINEKLNIPEIKKQYLKLFSE